MNTTTETIGLKVLSVSPSQKESGVNVNSTIGITFTSDVNPATLAKNVVVLEDCNRIYKNINSLKDYSQYTVVKGSITYSDKVLTFTPETPFKVNMCYILMLNDGIADITGNRLAQKYISCFFTELEASVPPVEIIYPKYGCILSEIPEFVWKNQASRSYVFQVAKNNSFELLLYSDVISGNDVTETITHKPSFNVQEGMYFIRVKSENGEWSSVHQIFIKPVTDAVVAEQDTPEMMNLEDFLDGITEPVEILEYFPPPDSVNNDLKTNIIYIKIKGKLEEDRIDFGYCSVYGETADEEHEEYSHEEVEGVWSLVYDNYFDVTYIIFSPASLEPEEKEEEPDDSGNEGGDETEEPSEGDEEPEIPPDDDDEEDHESPDDEDEDDSEDNDGEEDEPEEPPGEDSDDDDTESDGD